MAPERPALVPDCNNTTTINDKCYDYEQRHKQCVHVVPPPDTNSQQILFYQTVPTVTTFKFNNLRLIFDYFNRILI